MKMRHPDLDRTVDVPPSTARALQGSGWIEADPPAVADDDGDQQTASGERPEDSDRGER